MLFNNANTILQPENVQIDEKFTPPIFNVVSSSSNPLTWAEFSAMNQEHGKKFPSTKSVSNQGS